ncbi:MAG TPA: hypothetical protein VHW60_02870 [Caulobacteraceae bacterium]|nr:hypothetical protein [Caulobacteraceae bacterium]
MSKYEPLEHFLRSCSRAPRTFGEVEAILGFKLPESAHQHRGWWANEPKSHVQARAWMSAGWQVWAVKLDEGEVEFRRPSTGPEPSDWRPRDRIEINLGELPLGASRMLRDYAAENGGDLAAAASRALQEAAVARRGRLLDLIRANAPLAPDDSTDLIREDRDAR